MIYIYLPILHEPIRHGCVVATGINEFIKSGYEVRNVDEVSQFTGASWVALFFMYKLVSVDTTNTSITYVVLWPT